MCVKLIHVENSPDLEVFFIFSYFILHFEEEVKVKFSKYLREVLIFMSVLSKSKRSITKRRSERDERSEQTKPEKNFFFMVRRSPLSSFAVVKRQHVNNFNKLLFI